MSSGTVQLPNESTKQHQQERKQEGSGRTSSQAEVAHYKGQPVMTSERGGGLRMGAMHPAAVRLARLENELADQQLGVGARGDSGDTPPTSIATRVILEA